MTAKTRSTRLPRTSLITAFATACLTLPGCGGKGDSTVAAPQSAASSPAPAQITGISTPSGVSVVTAKNAQ